MDKKEKVVRLLAGVRELESSLKKLAELANETSAGIHSFSKILRESENNIERERKHSIHRH